MAKRGRYSMAMVRVQDLNPSRKETANAWLGSLEEPGESIWDQTLV